MLRARCKPALCFNNDRKASLFIITHFTRANTFELDHFNLLSKSMLDVVHLQPLSLIHE